MFDEKKFNEETPVWRAKVSKEDTIRILTTIHNVTEGEIQKAIIIELLKDEFLDNIEFVCNGSYLPSRILLNNTDGLINFEPKTEEEQDMYYPRTKKKSWDWSLDTYKELIQTLLERDNILFVHFGNTSNKEYNHVVYSLFEELGMFQDYSIEVQYCPEYDRNEEE